MPEHELLVSYEELLSRATTTDGNYLIVSPSYVAARWQLQQTKDAVAARLGGDYCTLRMHPYPRLDLPGASIHAISRASVPIRVRGMRFDAATVLGALDEGLSAAILPALFASPRQGA